MSLLRNREKLPDMTKPDVQKAHCPCGDVATYFDPYEVGFYVCNDHLCVSMDTYNSMKQKDNDHGN